MEGKGILNSSDGSKYVGDFKKGKSNGKGISYFTDGLIYDGEWKDSHYHGKSIENYPDGCKYEGGFKNRHGICPYFPDGNKYVINFMEKVLCILLTVKH
jgi:hypothetical protein